MQTNNNRLLWFNNARFGMFIHWGVYSLLGRGEWVRYTEDIPDDKYRKLAWQFNPAKYNPDEWASLAKKAGMKYMVLTTKHHDGFCLFDSKYTDFTSVKTAAQRDLVAEYVAACRRAGLGVGLYFSVKDWTFPAYFKGPENDPQGWEKLVRHFHNQTLELMGNYGKIDILFYDCPDDANFRGGWGDKTKEIWQTEKLNAQVRALQPDILINNRSGLEEDYSTPEQEIPAAIWNQGRMYESCVTMNNSWGYSAGDNDWKSTSTLIRQLIACAARGCNYLLNVGPDGNGEIPAQSVERLKQIGEWLSVNGEAIYGTERVLPNWWDYTTAGRITSRGNNAFLTIHNWPSDGKIIITQLKNKVLSAHSLSDGRPLSVVQEGRRTIISGLPQISITPFVSVVKLILDGKPEAPFFY